MTDTPHEAGDRFAALLPSWVPKPDREINEHDGDAEFDWMDETSDAYRTLAVSVSTDGVIHYAALLNDRDFRCNGRALLDDGLPPDVLDVLKRLYPFAPPTEQADGN